MVQATGGQPAPFFIVRALKSFANNKEGNIQRGDRFRTNRDRAFALQCVGLVTIEGDEVDLETKRVDSAASVDRGNSGDTGARPVLTVKRPRGRPRKVQDDSGR